VINLRRPLAGALGVLASAFACGFLIAPAARATPLSPSLSPLPGSSFQGADGNQDDALPAIDWQALQAAERVHHSPDPNAPDTAFTGGSEEDEPGQWDFTTEAGGVRPAKANILDAWASFDPQGGNAFLYLGFAREAAQLFARRRPRAATTFITFELNHDPRLWNNGRATIPCRSTGDVLVSYEAEGNEVSVVIQRWVTELTDPASGCATTGRLDDFTSFTPNADAQGAANATDIRTYLPGAYVNTIPADRFGETALNLGEVLGQGFDDPCFAFSSIWMHSRSSTSESSNMQDFVAPHPLTVRSCSASGTKFHDLNANGRRDTGEPGLPRWEIWADYDDDGERDVKEPFAVTDSEGQYVINDIRSVDGTYTLRETLLTTTARQRARAAPVICTYPNDGTPGGTGSAPGGTFQCGWPVNIANTTYARNRDFGNYQAVEPPPPPPPPPPTPSPIVPPGPKPPDANDSGHVGFRVLQGARACVRGLRTRILVSGTRVARVRVFVNGRLERDVRVAPLQKRVLPRLKLAQGRNRVRVGVTFQLGSGTPRVTLRRALRVCRPAAQPPFTG
jgi:hypothetical protein